MTYTIELSKNSIQNLDKQELTDRHIILVKVDVKDMPAHKAIKFMRDISKEFADKVAPAEIIVMPLEKTIEVFAKK